MYSFVFIFLDCFVPRNDAAPSLVERAGERSVRHCERSEAIQKSIPVIIFYTKLTIP